MVLITIDPIEVAVPYSQHPTARYRLTFRLAGSTLAALFVLVTPRVTAVAATSQPTVTPGSDATELAARQLPLLKVANKITQLTRKGAAPGYSGYGDIALSVPDKVVKLYWHGSVPAGVRALIGQSRSTARVNVISAPYTWQQLQVQTRRLRESRSDLATRGIKLTRITVTPGATGLDVGVDYATSSAPQTPTGARTSVAVNARTLVQRALGSGMPPVSVSNVPPATTSGTRDHDNSPWWGGSRISRPGAVCSSGFAVTINSADYLLTAGHCGGINTDWDVSDTYTGGPGSANYLGNEKSRIAADDTAIIRVNSTQPEIYDKGYNSAVGERVIGAVDTYIGSWICTEGATSGVRCAGQVYFADGTIYLDGLGWLNHESGAQSSAHLDAGGDSGGPVIVNSPTPGAVYATGTVTGYENSASCPSGIDPHIPTPICSHDVLYETIYNILSDWGATMK